MNEYFIDLIYFTNFVKIELDLVNYAIMQQKLLKKQMVYMWEN